MYTVHKRLHQPVTITVTPINLVWYMVGVLGGGLCFMVGLCVGVVL